MVGGEAHQRVMMPFFVVTLQPFRTDFSHLVQRVEHIAIQHVNAIRSIELLDDGIRIRFPRIVWTMAHAEGGINWVIL